MVYSICIVHSTFHPLQSVSRTLLVFSDNKIFLWVIKDIPYSYVNKWHLTVSPDSRPQLTLTRSRFDREWREMRNESSETRAQWEEWLWWSERAVTLRASLQTWTWPQPRGSRWSSSGTRTSGRCSPGRRRRTSSTAWAGCRCWTTTITSRSGDNLNQNIN